jgi:hypothetical protein
MANEAGKFFLPCNYYFCDINSLFCIAELCVTQGHLAVDAQYFYLSIQGTMRVQGQISYYCDCQRHPAGNTAESHVQDKVSKFLSIQQSSALEQMVSTNPMASSTTVRNGLELLPDSASKISPTKARLVARAVSLARARALQPFSHGEDLKGDEGSLTRLSSKNFLSNLVDAHNRSVKHLELNQLICRSE